MNPDEIEIRRLQVETHIGVPDEERAAPQTLWISVWMRPAQGFQGVQDGVQNTVDYYAVSLAVAELAASKPRHLIETLATDVAEFLLSTYPLQSVDVKVEKKILPNADFVAVKVTREAKRQ
ncbi:MAG: dihydroneopterin aldolase [Verrucomicrobia bacterium]|jgi:dihydroneopterin aldolase|nr:dihydroneopterin aldolase [Verrucomicrobiota bacterium]|tara:strand:+ start:41727 stop:42089 length:363 start_codon:yes stop_codon:yes gene_type:complete